MVNVERYDFKRELNNPCLRYFIKLLLTSHPRQICLPDEDMLSEVTRFAHLPWFIFGGSGFVLKDNWFDRIVYEFGSDFSTEYFDKVKIDGICKDWVIGNLGELSSLSGVDFAANIEIYNAARSRSIYYDVSPLFVYHPISANCDHTSGRFRLSSLWAGAAYGLRVKKVARARVKRSLYAARYSGKIASAKNFFTQALNAEKQFFDNRPDLSKWAESIKDVYTPKSEPTPAHTADCTPNEELPLQIEFSENVWFFLDRMVYCVEDSPGFYQGLYRILNYIELFGWGKPTVVSWYKEFEAACCGAGHYTFIQMRRHDMFIFDETPWIINEVKRRRKIADKQKKDILF